MPKLSYGCHKAFVDGFNEVVTSLHRGVLPQSSDIHDQILKIVALASSRKTVDTDDFQVVVNGVRHVRIKKTKRTPAYVGQLSQLCGQLTAVLEALKLNHQSVPTRADRVLPVN